VQVLGLAGQVDHLVERRFTPRYSGIRYLAMTPRFVECCRQHGSVDRNNRRGAEKAQRYARGIFKDGLVREDALVD